MPRIERSTRRRDAEDEPRSRPTRSSRRRDEEPEEDRPARGRGRRERDDDRPARGRSRDDDRDDDRPRRGRSRDEDDEPDRRPARGRSRGARDYGPARRDDDEGDEEYYRDDDDDRYSDGDRVSVDEAEVAGPGWGASEQYRKEARSGSSIDRISFDQRGETIVGLFLEEAPFASYKQRWVAAANRSFVVLKDDPLEGIGQPAKAYSAFNFVPLGSTDEDHDKEYAEELKVWIVQASPTLQKALEPDDSERGSRARPINDPGRYYEIRYFEKDNGFGDYEVTVLDDAQLEEYWRIDPPTDAEIETLLEDCYTHEDYPSLPTREEVEAVARKLMNADRPRGGRGGGGGRDRGGRSGGRRR